MRDSSERDEKRKKRMRDASERDEKRLKADERREDTGYEWRDTKGIRADEEKKR